MSEAATLRIAPIGVTGRPPAGEPAGSPPAAGRSDESGLLSEIRTAADSGADLVLLPQLSFSPYFPVLRNREALELGERFPSKPMAAAREAAGGTWLAASAYECVGEGVFYVTGELGSDTAGCRLSQRQHRVEAATGRYEQMFFSPGHERREAFDAPWGATTMLIGADVRDPDAWAEVASLGTRLVLASVSETAENWQGACRIAAGMAAIHGMALALVNRDAAPDEPDFAGGSFIAGPGSREIAADGDGLYSVEIPDSKVVEAS